MTCRLEKAMTDLLESADIVFTRPERDQNDPTALDFYLPSFNAYIKIKMFHTPRISRQLEAVPKGATAILLQGVDSVRTFERLCKQFRVD